MMPATISATLARASEAIGHTAAILDRLEAKAKARAERAEHLASIRARKDS
jgi:hypothetical protein